MKYAHMWVQRGTKQLVGTVKSQERQKSIPHSSNELHELLPWWKCHILYHR